MPYMFTLSYFGIFITTGFMTFIYISNYKSKYFNPNAFPSFYQRTKSVFVRLKNHFFLLSFAYIYNLGVFCFALPASIVISNMLDVTNYMLDLSNVIICFFINIFFVILLPSMYDLILNVFDNGVTKAITRWANNKLGNESENIRNDCSQPKNNNTQQKISGITINFEEVKNDKN